MSQSVPLTRESFDALQEELKRLIREERPKVIQDIAEARAHGDLSENAEYTAAKEKKSFIETRIREVEQRLSNAQVIDTSTLSSDRVVFGATVQLQDDDKGGEVLYTIVGVDEADVSQGKISLSSPIARALIGKEEGDSVAVKTPGGVRNYSIIEISFK